MRSAQQIASDVSNTPRHAGRDGISALADPVTMSWRDLTTSMITVSGDGAVDVVHAGPSGRTTPELSLTG